MLRMGKLQLGRMRHKTNENRGDIMKNKIILLSAISAIIPIILLIPVILRQKKLNNEVDCYKKQDNENVCCNNISIIDSKTIIEKITKLELEILKLKRENNRIIQQYNRNNPLINNNNTSDNNFKQVLNYNFFKEKNGAVIDLYMQGKPKEEIAKVLNKSIREVEMVINLVK